MKQVSWLILSYKVIDGTGFIANSVKIWREQLPPLPPGSAGPVQELLGDFRLPTKKLLANLTLILIYLDRSM